MVKPLPGQTEREYMGVCLHNLKEEGYDNPKQRIAVCLETYRRYGTEEKSPKPEKKSPKPEKKVSKPEKKVSNPKSPRKVKADEEMLTAGRVARRMARRNVYGHLLLM